MGIGKILHYLNSRIWLVSKLLIILEQKNCGNDPKMDTVRLVPSKWSLGNANIKSSKINSTLAYSHTCYSTILDTGATNHFFTAPTTTAPHPDLLEVQPDSDGIQVLLPNHSTITSTHKAKLNLPKLSDHATSIHLFPSLASGSLLSVSQLCDAGCTATFTKSSAAITH